MENVQILRHFGLFSNNVTQRIRMPPLSHSQNRDSEARSRSIFFFERSEKPSDASNRQKCDIEYLSRKVLLFHTSMQGPRQVKNVRNLSSFCSRKHDVFKWMFSTKISHVGRRKVCTADNSSMKKEEDNIQLQPTSQTSSQPNNQSASHSI